MILSNQFDGRSRLVASRKLTTVSGQLVKNRDFTRNPVVSVNACGC